MTTVPARAANVDRVALVDPLFVSDLHLAATHPRTLARFERLVAAEARAHAELVILGDLFEYWAGDDATDDEVGTAVISALRGLAASGVRTFVMHGNRDLLLGADFAAAAGATLLADPTLAAIDGQAVLLAHGDVYCTRDVAYQRFRAQARNPDFQRAFLAQPLAERRAFIGQVRAKSEQVKQTTAAEIMDVTPEAIADAMRAAGVTRMIHGHTHRPATHRFDLDGQSAERWVLPDWDLDADAPRGGYLTCRGNWQLTRW